MHGTVGMNGRDGRDNSSPFGEGFAFSPNSRMAKPVCQALCASFEHGAVSGHAITDGTNERCVKLHDARKTTQDLSEVGLTMPTLGIACNLDADVSRLTAADSPRAVDFAESSFGAHVARR